MFWNNLFSFSLFMLGVSAVSVIVSGKRCLQSSCDVVFKGNASAEDVNPLLNKGYTVKVLGTLQPTGGGGGDFGGETIFIEAEKLKSKK